MGIFAAVWAGVLGAAALAAGPGPASIALPAAPSIVRADGQVVAAVVPGNGRDRCAEIVLWRLGHAPRTIRRPIQCTAAGLPSLAPSITELAVAGTTVAWQERAGGDGLELTIWKATLERPKPVLAALAASGAGDASDPGGKYNGGLAGHGGLIVYASWTRCDPDGEGYARPCAAGQPDVFAQTLQRIGGGVIRRGADVLDPVAVDAGRVLVRHADGSLLLLDGPVARPFPATPGLLGAALGGRQLATLTRTRLAVYDTETGALTRTFPLEPAARALEGVQGGLAVLGRSGTTHLIRLADGRGATLPRAAHAQLEPAGLFSAAGARLVFQPRAAILRRFG